MRLYNIFYVCKACLPKIKAASVVEISNTTNEYKVTNWGGCKQALDEISKISCFRDHVDGLYSLMDSHNIRQEQARIPCEVKTIFEKTLLQISSSVEAVVELYNMLEAGDAGCGIDVKIPKCTSLKEYITYLKEIDFIFSQCPYLLHQEEEIRFNNVDVGSQWITFVVLGSSGAFYILNAFAKLIAKAIEIKSNVLVCKQQEEELEEMRQKNEVGEEVIDAFKKLKQITMDKCVKDLENEIRELDNNEERDKVKRSIECLVYMMDKGVEIYSSIETPKEIKALFPFQKDTIVLPDNILKLIEEKGSKKE